jgi:hypothetical protein
MKFNLVVEIDQHYIDEFLFDNPDMSLNDLKALLNNACYLGLDCTNAIIERQVGFGPCETYVKKTDIKSWGETWGDNFPTETECPIDVIEHHAESYDFPVSDDIISFARAMWNEGNLTEKLS